MKAKTKRLPRDLRYGHDGSVACSHRDLSCCQACAAKHVELVDIFGVHFWVTDPAERAQLGGAS